MKRVLIITYYWPPSGGAGVQRWLKTVKYLRNYGWEPVVYTPENPEAPVIDDSLLSDVPDSVEVLRTSIWEPYEFYKKLVGLKKGDKINAGFLSEKKKPGLAENLSVWIRGNLFIPDARRFWIKPSIRFLSEFLKTNHIDAIVSTGPPHSMHLIALGLKKNSGKPWLADFRDPWTGIDFYDQLKLTSWADKKHHDLENRVLTTADRVSIVSRHCAMDLTKLLDRHYDVVTNGFDPDDFSREEVPLRPGFELTHIGSLNKDRNPEALWQVLKELCDENEDFSKDLRLRFIGKCDIALSESLQRNGLSGRTQLIEYLAHDQVISEAAGSPVLMLLLNNTPNSRGIMPGKMYEYLAVRRPVFCIGPTDGDAAKVLEDAKAGAVCSFGDKEGIRRELLKLWDKYRDHTLQVMASDINIFSRKELAGRMAAILEEITTTRG